MIIRASSYWSVHKYLDSCIRIFWAAAFSILLRSNSGYVAKATRPPLRLEG